MTILKMVIISIKSLISVMCIMLIIAFNISGWLESVGSRVLYELDYKNPILYVIPIEIILGNRDCRWFLSVTPEQFRTAYTITFQMRLATAGRNPGTDAGCGLSTRGHWDGPAICFESQWVSRHSATWNLNATW